MYVFVIGLIFVGILGVFGGREVSLEEVAIYRCEVKYGYGLLYFWIFCLVIYEGMIVFLFEEKFVF